MPRIRVVNFKHHKIISYKILNTSYLEDIYFDYIKKLRWCIRLIFGKQVTIRVTSFGIPGADWLALTQVQIMAYQNRFIPNMSNMIHN